MLSAQRIVFTSEYLKRCNQTKTGIGHLAVHNIIKNPSNITYATHRIDPTNLHPETHMIVNEYEGHTPGYSTSLLAIEESSTKSSNTPKIFIPATNLIHGAALNGYNTNAVKLHIKEQVTLIHRANADLTEMLTPHLPEGDIREILLGIQACDLDAFSII